MNLIEPNLTWNRCLATSRLQAELLARSAEIGSASLLSMRRRVTRLVEFWNGMPGPLFSAGPAGPAAAGVRWADYLEDETRNATQAALLADWEIRDWSERFVRAVEGDLEA